MIMSSIGIRRRFFAVIARVSELVNLHSSSQTPEACSLLIGSLRSQSSTRGCLRLYCREAHLTSTQSRDNWNSLLIGRRSQSTVCPYKRIDRQCGTIPSEIVAGSEAEDAVESQESPPVRIENREAVIDDDEEDIWAPGSTRAKMWVRYMPEMPVLREDCAGSVVTEFRWHRLNVFAHSCLSRQFVTF